MIFSFLVLTENTVQAQVFKCVGNEGNIVYQDKACSTVSNQSEIKVHQLNSDVILKAQKELRDELNRREQLKSIRAQQALKEREIIAIEEQARSNEELAHSARKNTSAIEKNTETARFRKHSNYIYNNHPSYRHNQHKSGLNVNISIK